MADMVVASCSMSCSTNDECENGTICFVYILSTCAEPLSVEECVFEIEKVYVCPSHIINCFFVY